MIAIYQDCNGLYHDQYSALESFRCDSQALQSSNSAVMSSNQTPFGHLQYLSLYRESEV